MTVIRFESTLERESKLDFQSIDDIPYYNHLDEVFDHRTVERDEQLIVRQYILPTDSVLELGGRFGTVSCIINNILDDPKKHIVIEPDTHVHQALLKNRDHHNAAFTVYQNIISNEPSTLIHADYSTRVVCCDQSHGDTIPSIKLKEIADYHGIKFNALVADCEGCLERFIKDNMDLIPQLRLITYEQDFGDTCDYENVANILKQNGFVCLKEGFHLVWEKKPPMPLRGPKATIFARYINKYW